MNPAFWSGKRVLVTGHTGFKGGWLSLWLASLGAEVHGISLDPPTQPNLFVVARVGERMASSANADVRDYGALTAAITRARPEIIFHLAAQPLVRRSYRQPVDTYGVNVMGVVNLLEAVRHVGGIRAVVNVTTDKCYQNHEWHWGYRENEPMGGLDPYSSSKGCAELVTAAYQKSYMAELGIAVATARAGNVVGGGDWAEERLLPDVLRALDSRTSLTVRSPHAIRPWQHVLEPMSGYLTLAERLHLDGAPFAEPWNFGPSDDDAMTVGWIVEYVQSRYPELQWNVDRTAQPHEATYLKLDSGKARARLGWQPAWNLEKALDRTIAWHRAWREGGDMQALTIEQIDEHLRDSARAQAVDATL